MTRDEAADIIDAIWAAARMTDNSGTDKVRDELEAALLAAYERGVRDGKAAAGGE